MLCVALTAEPPRGQSWSGQQYAPGDRERRYQMDDGSRCQYSLCHGRPLRTYPIDNQTHGRPDMTIEYDPSRAALYTPEQQDTLFAAGTSYSPLQLAVEGARLAYYRAEERPAEAQRLTRALALAGFGAPTMFVDIVTSAAGFGALRATDNLALLAPRGTQPDDLTDIAHDLRANMVAWPETAGRVHAGFAAAARALLPQIDAWVERSRIDPRALIVTGHSLGAAMATLIASILEPAWLITLGSPRVGDAEFLATVRATNISRIVDCCDIVTQVPPPIGGYQHLATCTYVTQDGVRAENPSESFIDTDRMQARGHYLTNYAWRF